MTIACSIEQVTEAEYIFVLSIAWDVGNYGYWLILEALCLVKDSRGLALFVDITCRLCEV